MPLLVPRTQKISMNKGVLELSLTRTSPVKVEIFDVKGTLLKKVLLQNANAGVYRLNIAENSSVTSMLVVHASIGQRMMTFRCLPLHNGKYAVNSPAKISTPVEFKLAKIAADVDSLKVTATGYVAKVVTISSFDTLVNITLDTVTENFCEGCAKTDHPASGKATIDVDGAQREYTLKLPDNYDPNKSYKLIFCWHWMGGKMNDVVTGGIIGGPYYGLEKLANSTAIFVAPEGLLENGTSGWANTNGRDIKFLKAMLQYFNSTLCIDQKRIFSTGFSYGGMMSYAIGCAMADVFRAIAPMSGALYSGCDKVNNDPIAVWMAHGKSDEVVPLANGKTALQVFIERNGCGNETIPVDPSPCVQYQGCKEGFPIIYCEFNGGHGPQSFAPAASWAFFNQF